MDATIQVRDVSKTYGQGDVAIRALDRVTLEVAAGDILLLVGPSGSD